MVSVCEFSPVWRRSVVTCIINCASRSRWSRASLRLPRDLGPVSSPKKIRRVLFLGALLAGASTVPAWARMMDSSVISSASGTAHQSIELGHSTPQGCVLSEPGQFRCEYEVAQGQPVSVILAGPRSKHAKANLRLWSDSPNIRVDGSSFVLIEYSGWGQLAPDFLANPKVGPLHAQFRRGGRIYTYTIWVTYASQTYQGALPSSAVGSLPPELIGSL
jgi:hypothetical protein